MAAVAKNQPKSMRPKWFAWLIIFVGIVGLIASFTLTVDKLHVLKNPHYTPPCNINPVFSCGSVMITKQAEIWGVPNTLVGIAAFSVLITIGACMLFGARLNKRFWQLFQLGALGGLAGVVYLFFQGVYRIHAICIYCMSVWIVIILLNWYTLMWSIDNKTFSLPKSLDKPYKFVRRHHLDILIVIYLAIIALVVNHFWYYFGPH